MYITYQKQKTKPVIKVTGFFIQPEYNKNYIYKKEIIK